MPQWVSPEEDVRDVLLTELAIRIQLSPTNYRLAVGRIDTLAAWLDRAECLLSGRVRLIYPQGSMAINATIASCLRRDEFDIDVIVQMDLLTGTTPEQALDLLYWAIKGEKGSRYYSMTHRNTRCVTVEYAEMHVDLTPAELLPGREPRISHIFHHRPEEPGRGGVRVVANPFGFAEWFNEVTPRYVSFEKSFAARSLAMDSLLAKAVETEDVPEQVPGYLKPPSVVALQLIKRYRNVRYETRKGRRPPGVLLACLVAQSHSGTGRLFNELLYQARELHKCFTEHQGSGQLVYVANPRCPEDIFSDRWPANLTEQEVYVQDLRMLVSHLERLEEGADLETIGDVLSQLFGEAISETLLREFVDRSGESIASGAVRTRRATGRIDLARSGIVTSVAASSQSSSSRSSPRHTFFGPSEPGGTYD
jgi:Second Messenger Oligonucleotide or Dinucleotide Synthetase domain